ncbi:MAG TPA: SDR family NAD(P)-dependent oxidoreductase [Intrasporangium sp.]|uniref:SDR family NAD(P)-dependent oxidoreductase n=1 Tax=Intrasporangium sp. TaxID=1925024 RepID=UPI002D776570|nr:SDR family NAD(P)-dependent oxidoreductase [Intrasporangium sp.]HET7398831.1 SDR family NAD(P)-dependent oxidoreductase [Intrasporangium sp.]
MPTSRPFVSAHPPSTPRRVLVTGAASGLGLALVRELAARGDHVVATDLGPGRPAVLPDAAAYRQLDVRSEADWEDARRDVAQRWGGLDVLVNNAGVAAGGRIDVTTMDDWRWIVETNLLGVVRGCRAFVPVFKDQGDGHIVNVASLAGLVHAPGMASYNTVKAGVVALSETLSHELAPYGIAVSVVCPSFFRTNLHTSLRGADVELERSAVSMITTARRSAEHVAGKVVLGIDARRDVILTDVDGRLVWWAKRHLRPVYRAAMRRAARDLARGRSPRVPR